ncbi:MAG: ferritin-like domain-containing protein [Anaerolineae bacterium]
MSILLNGADVIDLAVQAETRGERFYREAAEAALDADARALFSFLREEEIRHKQVFEGLAHGIVLAELDPSTAEDVMGYIAATVDQAFFAKDDATIRLVPAGADVPDMIRRAIAFEQQTLLFFHSLRDLVQPANQALVDRIIQEERSHVRRLAARLP